MEVFLVMWLAAWIIPVVVLFNKGQTGWAVSGLLVGWSFAIIWIIAAFTTQNRRKMALDERRHAQTLMAMPGQVSAVLPTVVEPSIDDRLATLDRLRVAQKITAEEYAEQRQEIIRGI